MSILFEMGIEYVHNGISMAPNLFNVNMQKSQLSSLSLSLSAIRRLSKNVCVHVAFIFIINLHFTLFIFVVYLFFFFISILLIFLR